jgi:hypothetical protein
MSCGCENNTQCQRDMSFAIFVPLQEPKASAGTDRQECLTLRSLNFVLGFPRENENNRICAIIVLIIRES